MSNDQFGNLALFLTGAMFVIVLDILWRLS
jgi:hypothetical protein